MTAVALIFLTGLPVTAYAGEKAVDYKDVVILSTTDMHGKCWNTNVLTDSTQSGSMLKTKKVTGAGIKSVTVKKLKAGKLYYVRIRTWKKAGSKIYYSKWSKVKKIKTK